jgi:hypothetical protein
MNMSGIMISREISSMCSVGIELKPAVRVADVKMALTTRSWG